MIIGAFMAEPIAVKMSLTDRKRLAVSPKNGFAASSFNDTRRSYVRQGTSQFISARRSFDRTKAPSPRAPLGSAHSTNLASVRQVLPLMTDSGLSKWLEPHLVSAPARPVAPARLWVFLSGSYGLPQRQKSLIEFLADRGYWAINLRYPNDWTISGLSQGHPDNHIHELLRLQVIDGQPRTDLIKIPAPDCIENRLQKLLVWLNRSRPGEGWHWFLNDAQMPLWQHIAVAGHSQGGGHAAMLGKIRPLHRVVMLAAPSDSIISGPFPAPWLEAPGQTSGDRYFGFSHAKDPAIRAILAAWQMLDLARFGPVVTLEDHHGQLKETHRLITTCRVPEGDHHASVGADRFFPRQPDGRPVFERVWSYLFDAWDREE